MAVVLTAQSVVCWALVPGGVALACLAVGLNLAVYQPAPLCR